MSFQISDWAGIIFKRKRACEVTEPFASFRFFAIFARNHTYKISFAQSSQRLAKTQRFVFTDKQRLREYGFSEHSTRPDRSGSIGRDVDARARLCSLDGNHAELFRAMGR